MLLEIILEYLLFAERLSTDINIGSSVGLLIPLRF